MLDRPTVGDPSGGDSDGAPDDAPDDAEATAPLAAVSALVHQLDAACPADAATWRELVAVVRARAAELARGDRTSWRLAAGSAVPLAAWTAGSWAAALRAALLRDGFTGAGADRAVEVVAVHLLRTCPTGQAAAGGTGPEGPLGDYPVLARLRQQLSADAGDGDARDDDLLTGVEALRRAGRP